MKCDVYSFLEREIPEQFKEKWNDWFVEYVNIDIDGKVVVECYPPSPDGFNAALTEEEFKNLKRMFQKAADEAYLYYTKILKDAVLLAINNFECKFNISSYDSTLIIHKSWRNILKKYKSGKFLCIPFIYGADLSNKENGIPQSLVSSSKYGRWVNLF